MHATARIEHDDRVYVILGATGAIGGALAAELRERGARLALAGRDEDKLQERFGDWDARLLAFDATSFEAMQAQCEQVLEWAGRVDGIVNCCGSVLLKPAHLTSLDDFQQVMATNVTTAFAAVRAAAKALRENGGSVVLVSSAAAEIGLSNHEAIAAAKGAIAGLTRSAAATYASKQIRVNAVAPGLVRSQLTERITSNEKALEASLAMHALGRVGEPEDVAGAISWLVSPAAAWVTGQVIGIDGGLAQVKTRGR